MPWKKKTLPPIGDRVFRVLRCRGLLTDHAHRVVQFA